MDQGWEDDAQRRVSHLQALRQGSGLARLRPADWAFEPHHLPGETKITQRQHYVDPILAWSSGTQDAAESLTTILLAGQLSRHSGEAMHYPEPDSWVTPLDPHAAMTIRCIGTYGILHVPATREPTPTGISIHRYL
jgi:hypothetical protein